jgi:hypothetical protein
MYKASTKILPKKTSYTGFAGKMLQSKAYRYEPMVREAS